MSAMEVLSPEPHRFPYGLATDCSYYDGEQVSAGSTPFASAPSSPSRSKMHDFFYSVPSSPSHGVLDSLDHSTDLQASVPFSWEEAPGTPKRINPCLDPDFAFISLILQDRRSLSAPTSPQREHTSQFEPGKGIQNQWGQASGKGQHLQEVEQELDSDFQFTSSAWGEESLASPKMSSADELFFKGRILPLKLPPRMQGLARELAPVDSVKCSSSISAPQSPSRSPRSGGAPRIRSILGLKNTSTDAKGNPRQGWAKTLTPLRLLRKDQQQHQAKVTKNAGSIPLDHQITNSKDSSTKSLESSTNHLRILDVNDIPSQAQNVKGLSNVHGRDGQHSHRPGLSVQPLPENISVKKWFGKDGDKRTKNGAARSWPRPSARSVLATRSARDTTSSRQGTLPVPHELHYRTNGVTSEQMRRRTFLPYKQTLLGCLGFGYMKFPGLSSTFEAIGR
ncbi:hypothetical protein O6H91_15G088000 [Diphasiastrum complanatum]|uniref:Uncharacterized protein n=1 Tax=Diphasiastrum complanatum TaxID=34168 RepID=A0ACC2BKS8_DIPCM|nr:hypothetical protein O6H91_15G088000 [Diphasiastrum complanatum]